MNLFRALVGTQQVSSTVFFVPAQEFLVWAKRELFGRLLFDVGCGSGSASRLLRKAGLTTWPLDLMRPLTGTHHTTADGTTYPYTASSVVVLCRPCHGEFTMEVVRQAVARRVGDVLYVGLEKNVEADLGEYASRFEKMLDGAGEDGEKVWRYKLVESKRETSMIVSRVAYGGTGLPAEERRSNWVQDRGDRWVNASGGYRPKQKDDVVYETLTVGAGDWDSLDYSNTCYGAKFNRDKDAGWLAPDGTFFGCSSAEHDSIAYYVLKKDVDVLETTGYVRVDGRPNPARSWCSFRAHKQITDVQREWLSARGHSLEEYGEDINVVVAERERREAQRLLATVPQNGPRKRQKYEGD